MSLPSDMFQMNLFSDALVKEACEASSVSGLSDATIGEVLLVARYLEEKTGIPFIRMDQGSPGLPINEYGILADLQGLESHGVQRLIRYHRGVKSGVIRPDAVPEVVHETPLSVVLDAHSAMGQIAAVDAMERAIAKAKQYGFGAAVVRNSNHFGVGGYYAMMAEREDMLGMCFTNTQAICVPTFGREVMLGTNPIAFAMPADPIPMLYDVATTVVPRGKLEVYAKQGKPMPLGWAVDDAGGQDALLAGATLAAVEAAGDAAHGVHLLLEVHGQGEEVDAVAGTGGSGGEDEHAGVAVADHDGGVGEFGELADLEGQRTAGELHFILVVAGKLTVGDDGGHDHTPFQIFVGSLVRPFST